MLVEFLTPKNLDSLRVYSTAKTAIKFLAGKRLGLIQTLNTIQKLVGNDYFLTNDAVNRIVYFQKGPHKIEVINYVPVQNPTENDRNSPQNERVDIEKLTF